ncbi:MAG: ATP-binding protein [Chromatiaceae bacterium]|nr:ATP-binding protein [Chromatiaceae bacterium]MCF8003307.1 ATP-binding protein [Chromatiaceae bacterium]
MGTACQELRIEIDSRLECVTPLGVCLQALAQQLGFDDLDAYQIRTCCVEALNNAVLHAYAGEPGHVVGVRWQAQAGELIVEIEDQGCTMSPPPLEHEPEPDAESGRGWWIMRQWMDSVEYCNQGEHHCVRLRRHIRGHSRDA